MIDTPSYQQVTRPLYQSSIGKWRHYEKQMEPMDRFLGQWVKSFAYPEN
jgi:hypothetical protein